MSCTDVQTIQAGNASKVQFSFDFPYIFKSEIHVYFWNATTKEWDEKLTTDATYPWQITDANPTIVEFTGTAPPAPAIPVDPNEQTVDNVRIRRITQIDDIRALFNPGSAIRSDDLNKNFEQVRYAIQEANCQGVTDDVDQFLRDYYWDRFDNTLYSTETWRSDDATIATTASLDARFRDEVQDTLTKQELIDGGNVMPDNDDAVPTTGAVNTYINEVITNDIGADATGITVTDDGDGTITLGLAADSIDLDRIKSGDIVASGETWANDNVTIATTAAIDDIIDTAITNDIGVDATGLSVTDDGDGTITLGITAGGVDFDRINPDDIITQSEQDGGATANDDTVFTSLAAARRFDTLVQTANPGTSTNWEVGKTWLQNDSDLTLSIWNGTGWTAVSSGGAFRTQPKVVYVDVAGGNDSSQGHRISSPKRTIKAAIEQINGEIGILLTGGGSGYVEGTYSNVPLTGGTSTGLLANITVNAGGAVDTVAIVNTSTLENYSIGDVLSASNADLGGTGSGLTITVDGDGDGQIVVVAAGVYQEIAPIQIKRRNVSIIGQALRSCIVHPTPQTENNTLFELNSGSYVSSLTITGVKAGSGTGNPLDPDLPGTQGWNFAFYNDAFIVKSPYIQNCTNFSDSEIDNSALNAHNPAGGIAGDLDSAPTGGGLLINGATPHDNSPLRSMVCDSYTHVGLNGPGILVVNNGYCQATSSYAFFNKYHIKCRTGGQANLAASTTDFGEKALVADGKSTTAIFTSNVDGAIVRNVDNDPPIVSFNINAPTADASWHGTATRPQGNMLVEVTHPTSGTVIYPVLSAVAHTDAEGGAGWTVTISRPNTNNRSINDGLEDDIDDDAAVSFYLRSQIASSGHTMEYVGSGMDYRALPENGGVPDDTKQINESNGGKIWTAITDQNGKFSVGDFFNIDQRTGFVSFSAGSVAFDVVTDSTPQLGGDLDVNGKSIVSANNGNISITPNGSGKVIIDGINYPEADGTANQVLTTNGSGQLSFTSITQATGSELENVVEDLSPQLGGNLDVKANSITTSTQDGNITIAPNGTGKVAVSGNIVKKDDANTNSNLVLEPKGTGTVDVSTSRITNVSDPTNAQDAATRNYVDNISSISDDNSNVTVVDDGQSAGQVTITADGNQIALFANAGITFSKDITFTASQGFPGVLPTTGGTMTGNIAFNSGQDIDGFVPEIASPSGAPGGLTTTGAADIPKGTDAQRPESQSIPADPADLKGYFRFNTTSNEFEGHDGTAWGAIGGGTSYPLMGALGTNRWAVEHANTIDADYTITSGNNVINAGPMTVNAGKTVTVESNAHWVIA